MSSKTRLLRSYLMELLPFLYYYHEQPCEYNISSIYQSILMKLCMQAYIHKISDEFKNQIDLIIFARVIALFVLSS